MGVCIVEYVYCVECVMCGCVYCGVCVLCDVWSV